MSIDDRNEEVETRCTEYAKIEARRSSFGNKIGSFNSGSVQRVKRSLTCQLPSRCALLRIDSSMTSCPKIRSKNRFARVDDTRRRINTEINFFLSSFVRNKVYSQISKYVAFGDMEGLVFFWRNIVSKGLRVASCFRSVATGVAETRLESARLLECPRFCFAIAGIWNVW